jgi:hypothetical protein
VPHALPFSFFFILSTVNLRPITSNIAYICSEKLSVSGFQRSYKGHNIIIIIIINIMLKKGG